MTKLQAYQAFFNHWDVVVDDYTIVDELEKLSICNDWKYTRFGKYGIRLNQ